MSGKIQNDTTCSLEGHSMCTSKEGFVNEFISLCVFSCKNKFPGFRQCLHSFRIIIAVRAGSPNGFFIQLKFFALRNTINHSSQPGITQRKSFFPHFSRSVIPQFKLLSRYTVSHNNTYDQ